MTGHGGRPGGEGAGAAPALSPLQVKALRSLSLRPAAGLQELRSRLGIREQSAWLLFVALLSRGLVHVGRGGELRAGPRPKH